MTVGERYNKTIDIWTSTSKKLADEMMKMMEKDESISLFFLGCAVESDMTATPFGVQDACRMEQKTLRNQN